MLPRAELPVARHLDVGEVDEAAARDLGSIDYAPAFVSVKPLDDARYRACLPTRLPRYRMPSQAVRCSGRGSWLSVLVGAKVMVARVAGV